MSGNTGHRTCDGQCTILEQFKHNSLTHLFIKDNHSLVSMSLSVHRESELWVNYSFIFFNPLPTRCDSKRHECRRNRKVYWIRSQRYSTMSGKVNHSDRTKNRQEKSFTYSWYRVGSFSSFSPRGLYFSWTSCVSDFSFGWKSELSLTWCCF